MSSNLSKSKKGNVRKLKNPVDLVDGFKLLDVRYINKNFNNKKLRPEYEKEFVRKVQQIASFFLKRYNAQKIYFRIIRKNEESSLYFVQFKLIYIDK